MRTRTKIAVILAAALVAGLILIVRFNPLAEIVGNEPRPDNGDSVTQSVLEQNDRYNQMVRSAIAAGNISRPDSIGIRNYLPADCGSSTPLIELRTFERLLDATIRPLHVATLGLQSQVPRGMTLSGGSYGVNGFGLRLVLAHELDGSLHLIFDTEYTATGIYHRPEDPNNVTRGMTSELEFTTPKELGPGDIYRVDLILIDRIKEKEAMEHKKIRTN